MNQPKDKPQGVKRCIECKRFIGSKGENTVRFPDKYYCNSCFEKGLDEEKRSMYGECYIHCVCE